MQWNFFFKEKTYLFNSCKLNNKHAGTNPVLDQPRLKKAVKYYTVYYKCFGHEQINSNLLLFNVK